MHYRALPSAAKAFNSITNNIGFSNLLPGSNIYTPSLDSAGRWLWLKSGIGAWLVSEDFLKMEGEY